MRYIRFLLTIVPACVLIAGCSSDKETSRKNLAEQIDLARRRYDCATAMLANPLYIERATGRYSPIPHKLMGVEDIEVPTTRPASNLKAEAKLAEARKRLAEALSANPDAPAATRSEANHLLGKIQLATGKYHCTGAECLRSRATALRRRAHRLLDLARSNARLAEFVRKLANPPRGNINDLRDEAAGQLTKLDTALKNIDRELASLNEQNATLSKDNEKWLTDARSLRDRSEITGGSKGLELLKQALKIEKKVNSNASKIAANQQRAEILKFDRTRLQKDRRDADLRLTAVKNHLQKMDNSSRSAMDKAKIAHQRALENQEQVKVLAGQVVKHCEEFANREKLAAAALEEAVKHLGEAEKAVRKEISAARTRTGKSNEMAERMSNEQHLALIIAAKGSASLLLGDLRVRQIATAKANTALADSVSKVWKLLGQQEARPVVAALKEYLADAETTRDLAEKNYKKAEADLEEIQKLHLKGRVAKNTAWNSQALLANAYLGHFRLTGDQAILNKARDFVAKALEGKKGSPYMARVVDLQRLIAMQAEHE